MAGSESEERQLPPSQRKLRRLRESGQVASSQDFPTALVFCAGLVVIALTWHNYVDLFAASLRLVGEAAGQRAGMNSSGLLSQVSWLTMATLAPVLLVTGSAGLIAHMIFKGGLVVSVEPLTPNFTRLNPVEGFKKLFGFRSRVEFPLVLLRCLVLLASATVIVVLAVPALLASPQCGIGCVLTVGIDLLRNLMILAILLVLVLALLDLPLQSFLFRHEQKMSRSELKRERKQDQGAPEIVKKRKEEHKRLAEPGGGSDLDSMTIVIASSENVVALSYDPQSTPVPVVVGKGKAARSSPILKKAKAMRVPIEGNVDLAEELSRVGVGNMVPQRLFQDVAMSLVKHGLAKTATN